MMISHSSDTQVMSEGVQKKELLKSRLTLVGLIATFIVPLLLAMVLYARLDIWSPSTFVNHGKLMDPVGPLSFFSMEDASGRVYSQADIEGRWTMIYLAESDCRIECQSQLFKMRQARAMLGRDLVRVQNVYIALGDEAFASIQSTDERFSKFIQGRVPDGQRRSLLNAFRTEAGGHFYLIDPLGNLVLDYDQNSTTKGIVKDLKRLLKVSNIG